MNTIKYGARLITSNLSVHKNGAHEMIILYFILKTSQSIVSPGARAAYTFRNRIYSIYIHYNDKKVRANCRLYQATTNIG